MPIFVSTNVQDHLPVIRTIPAAQSETWAWASETKSFMLPVGDTFLLKSDSHVLLVLHCQTRVKISNKKRRVDKTHHSILVPIGYTVQDVLKLIRNRPINGIYHEPEGESVLFDSRALSELGWTNGTVLRLELW